MNFSTIVIGAGIAAMAVVSHLQSEPALAFEDTTRATMLDPSITGAVFTASEPTPAKPSEAVRLIDLRSGATCRAARPAPAGHGYEPALLGPQCSTSPELQQVTQWRLEEDGTLNMADGSGQTVLRFMPGDGVLYESVYPAHALVTIVPARS